MTSRENLSTFFAECTDFELCDALYLTIENVYGFDSLRPATAIRLASADEAIRVAG